MFEVMETAVFAMADCLTAAGLDMVKVELEDEGFFAGRFYSYSALQPEDVNDQELDDIHQRCWNKYLSQIEPMWADVNGPSEIVEKRFREQLDNCLALRGLSSATASDVNPVAFDTCWAKSIADFPELKAGG